MPQRKRCSRDGYGSASTTSLDSTNEEARRLADAGEAGPLWIVAREQTAGRGRRGREWVSSRGNLFATLLLRPAKPRRDLRATVFCGRACRGATWWLRFAPQSRVALKWPNDVLVDGKKVAGILLEVFWWPNAGVARRRYRHQSRQLSAKAPNFPQLAGECCWRARRDAEEALAVLAARLARMVWSVDEKRLCAHPRCLARARRGPGRAHPGAAGARSDVQGVFERLDDDGALLLARGQRQATPHRRGRGFLQVITMLLAIDAGNTNIVFAVCEGRSARAMARRHQARAHRRRICGMAGGAAGAARTVVRAI